MSEEAKDKAVGAGAPTPSTGKSEAELKLEKELQAARDIIAKQNEEMTLLSAQVGPKKNVLKVKNKFYQCLAKGNVHIDGQWIKAEDLVKDTKLVEELIGKGSGLFLEVKDKPKKGGS